MEVIAMWNDVSIASILNNITCIKNIAVIRCITSLSPCYSNFIANFCSTTMSVFLLLTIDLILTTNIFCMGCIFEVYIIATINLNDITTLNFADNILISKLIIRILHQKFFADNSIIRNLAIKVMIMVSM